MEYRIYLSGGEVFVVDIDFTLEEVIQEDGTVRHEVSSWWITHLNGRQISVDLSDAVREFINEEDLENEILSL